ncbi:Transferase [Trema orientale]|uniref:Transferase n=1 Tax=Trema orientale TaxID=63057 RepID=A0A2P5CCL5_TREOI|nr:Transferase [Trema orientale]
MKTHKVEILSRDLVKPSSPTPAHLKDYKLCLLDQFYPEIHCGIIFFYTSPPNWDKNDDKNYCRILKNSLSETLTDFYPIAGRFKDTSTIDCNDEGACVVEAKLDSNLSDFLSSDDLQREFGKLNPSFDPETMELASNCILIAQLTVFECGGSAICFCLKHRFCDLASVVVLLKSWSARARGGSAEIAVPSFVGSSFLAPQALPPLPETDNPIENRTARRLVFEASKISALKKKFLAEKNPSTEIDSVSRVEVVLALILKSAISAARSIDKSPAKKSSFLSAVNLRRRTAPPLPENSIGNLIWGIPMEVEGEIGFQELLTDMKRETTTFCNETVRRVRGDEEGYSLVFESMKKQEEILKETGLLDLYWCSSWCRFSVYEVDFGWGKPVWVSSGILSSQNLIVMEDTKCGNGIQAWVTLDPQVMAIFECDEDIVSFASFNPNILA